MVVFKLTIHSHTKKKYKIKTIFRFVDSFFSFILYSLKLYKNKFEKFNIVLLSFKVYSNSQYSVILYSSTCIAFDKKQNYFSRTIHFIFQIKNYFIPYFYWHFNFMALWHWISYKIILPIWSFLPLHQFRLKFEKIK